MITLQTPKAPPDALRYESFRILSRLLLVFEFRPWLEYTRDFIPRYPDTPFALLWDCISIGSPLNVLLDLLGSGPSPSNSLSGRGHLVGSPTTVDVGSVDPELSLSERQRWFGEFIQRVQLLEGQSRLPYGEVLRVQDLFESSNPGWAKVLRTIDRILGTLQETYPGLYVPPRTSSTDRGRVLLLLLETEQEHVNRLDEIRKRAMSLSERAKALEPCLECLIVNGARLIQYHDHVLAALTRVVSDGVEENWDAIFRLHDPVLRMNITAAYRSICANFIGLGDFFTGIPEASILLHDVCDMLSRLSTYQTLTQTLLNLSTPNTCPSYDTLCNLAFQTSDISESIDEVGRQIRTLWAARALRGRVHPWSIDDLRIDDFGTLLLDDLVTIDPMSDSQYSLFLFEASLLGCQEGFGRAPQDTGVRMDGEYPIRSWEKGPALGKTTPLNMAFVVPTRRLEAVRLVDDGCLEIDYVIEEEERVDRKTKMWMVATVTRTRTVLKTLRLFSLGPRQLEQWLVAIQIFVPPIYRPPLVNFTPFDQDGSDVGFSDGEDNDDEHDGFGTHHGGRRQARPRPWSAIARKGPRSEASSIFRVDIHGTTAAELQLTPALLPALFGDADVPVLLSSASINPPTLPPTPPPEDDEREMKLVDLTGKVTREGRFPVAHGGFSDVWKGVWHKGKEDKPVAVKVLRSRVGDADREQKMVVRLQRELQVWKRLSHPHVLELYGTTSDFGYYNSMVCPWLENGSLSKYIEQCGDIVSVGERLQLLCEVADGLAYLHSCHVIHGDLTGANILIDNDKKAKLCDFGLSTLVAEFHGPSYYTSTIAGAVRWADPKVCCVFGDETAPAAITTHCDVYSFGSVMLELLSGRIPYHYLRNDVQVVIELHNGNKPRRPAQSFVNDAQWALIVRCWAEDHDERPEIDEVRRVVRALRRL